MKNQHFVVLGLMLLLIPCRLMALNLSINMGAGAEHTDNALKSNVSQRAELEKNINVNLNLNHIGESVVAAMNYRVAFTSYDKGSQDDVTVIVGDASLVYEQIKDRLFWTIENNRSNVIRDKRLVDVESNREDRSISTISPTFILRPSSVDSINTSISYADIDYEDSDQQDSERVSANINWRHTLSKVDSVSAGFSYQDVIFDLGSNDYEYYRGVLSYEVELSKLQYSIVLGYNQSKREFDDINGGYFSISANYQDGVSNWALSMIQELTDTSRQDNNDDLTGLGDSNNIDAGVDIFERSSIELTYKNESLCDACAFHSSLLYEIEDYEILGDDGDELAFDIGIDYRFSRLTSLGGGVTYSDFSFDGANIRGDYNVVEYRLNLKRNLGRNLSLSFFVTYSERDSDQNSGDYEELRGGGSFDYHFD